MTSSGRSAFWRASLRVVRDPVDDAVDEGVRERFSTGWSRQEKVITRASRPPLNRGGERDHRSVASGLRLKTMSSTCSRRSERDVLVDHELARVHSHVEPGADCNGRGRPRGSPGGRSRFPRKANERFGAARDGSSAQAALLDPRNRLDELLREVGVLLHPGRDSEDVFRVEDQVLRRE